MSPTRDDFPHTHINDLGFQAVKNVDGEVVFNVEVGGYFSVKRNTVSVPLGVAVKPDQVRSISRSVSNSHQRLSFLVISEPKVWHLVLEGGDVQSANRES